MGCGQWIHAGIKTLSIGMTPASSVSGNMSAGMFPCAVGTPNLTTTTCLMDVPTGCVAGVQTRTHQVAVLGFMTTTGSSNLLTALSPFAARGRTGGRRPGREERVHLTHTNSHLLLFASFFLPLACSAEYKEESALQDCCFSLLQHSLLVLAVSGGRLRGKEGREV